MGRYGEARVWCAKTGRLRCAAHKLRADRCLACATKGHCAACHKLALECLTCHVRGRKFPRRCGYHKGKSQGCGDCVKASAKLEKRPDPTAGFLTTGKAVLIDDAAEYLCGGGEHHLQWVAGRCPDCRAARGGNPVFWRRMCTTHMAEVVACKECSFT